MEGGRGGFDTDTREESDGTTKADAGLMQPQARERRWPPDAGREKGQVLS